MSEKRFTDIWCSETGHIGVTDCGIDKEFTSDEFEDLLNEQQATISALMEENEKLKKWLSLYDEDEVGKYLRTHPMPTTTITNKRKVIPLDMRHK